MKKMCTHLEKGFLVRDVKKHNFLSMKVSLLTSLYNHVLADKTRNLKPGKRLKVCLSLTFINLLVLKYWNTYFNIWNTNLTVNFLRVFFLTYFREFLLLHMFSCWSCFRCAQSIETKKLKTTFWFPFCWVFISLDLQ